MTKIRDWSSSKERREAKKKAELEAYRQKHHRISPEESVLLNAKRWAAERSKWRLDLERELLSEGCRESFWLFAQHAFGIAHHPKGYWLTERVHKPLCDWFQSHIEDWLQNRKITPSTDLASRRQKRLLVIVPREFGKTTLITQAGTLWMHLRDPELSIYLGGESLEKAIDILRTPRTVLMGDDPSGRFAWLYGRGYQRGRLWRRDSLDHAYRVGVSRKDPSYGTWGVDVSITGKHPDALFFDDPISYDKMRRSANWRYDLQSHIASLEYILTMDGLLCFIGTRYHDGDHIGYALRYEGLRSVTGMPGALKLKDDGLWDAYVLDSRDDTKGGAPTYPEVWPDWRLKKEEIKDNLKYNAQMRNNPGASEFNPFTEALLEECWVERKDVPKNLRISFHCDTAFKTLTGQVRGDNSVICVWGHSRDGSGDVYFLESASGVHWRSEDFLDQLVILLQKYRKLGRWPAIVTDELDLGGKRGAWESAVKNFCHVKNIPMPNLLLINRGHGAPKSKTARLIEAAAYWASGHVYLIKDAPGAQELGEQMCKIGVSEHDDFADASADVFHKDCYQPARRAGDPDDLAPEPVQPWDEYLTGRKITNEEALRLYDRHNEQVDIDVI